MSSLAGVNRSVSLLWIVSAKDTANASRATAVERCCGCEEAAEIVDNVVNVAAVGPSHGPVDGAAHPRRGHAEGGGGDQVLGHIFDHQRGLWTNLVTPQQLTVARERWLGLKPSHRNVDDPAERLANAK